MDAQPKTSRSPLQPALLAAAQLHYQHCALCEHRCGVNRTNGERGPCKASATPHLFRHRIEYGEEIELVPSHLFYLSGCDLRCAFCIAGVNAFDPLRGRALNSEMFNSAVRWGQQQGARNIQWVGGEPSIHIPAILSLMAKCPQLPPIVWKSDFHCTVEAMELLRPAVDVYVADFKFGNDRCARSIAGVDNYVEIITRNLAIAARNARLIVRHLLLPGHFDCCVVPIVQWMREHLPDVEFSLRDGYLPAWRAGSIPGLDKPNSSSEVSAANQLVSKVGLRVIA